MRKGLGLSDRARLAFASIFILISISASVYNIHNYEVAQQSLFSHLFGSIAGFLVGFTFLKDTSGNKWNHKWKPLLWCLGSSIYVLILLFFIEFNLIKSFLNN